MTQVVKGQVYAWRSWTCLVTRVSRKNEWADMKVFGPRSAQPLWSKRQPMPLSDAFELVTE